MVSQITYEYLNFASHCVLCCMYIVCQICHKTILFVDTKWIYIYINTVVLQSAYAPCEYFDIYLNLKPKRVDENIIKNLRN